MAAAGPPATEQPASEQAAREQATAVGAVPRHASWLAPLLTERPRPAVVASSRHGWWLAVGAVCLGAFMGQLDASIVTLTYRPLERQFRAGPASVEWVSLSYLLALIALLAPAGRLSDAHGRKLFYGYGFALFTAASAACGFAPTLAVLVICRVAQAGGAALLQANSVALVTTSAPPGRMRAALGMQAAGQALGLALGPTIGGLLVSGAGWRWVFWVNVPVGVLALVAARYLLPRTRQRNPVSGFDWWGLALLAVTTVALLLAISAGSGLPLGAPWITVPALLVITALGGWGLVAHELRARCPLLDMRLIRTGGLRLSLLGALCGYLVLFGPLVLVPVELASATRAGLVLTALPAGFAVAALLAERLLPAGWPDRRRALLGVAVCVVGCVTLLAVPADPLPLAGTLLLLGLGLGTYAPANNATVMRAIPPAASGSIGGLVSMARGLGTALGVAVVTLALRAGTGDGARIAALALLGAATLAAASTLAVREPRG
jgi:MFS family permease